MVKSATTVQVTVTASSPSTLWFPVYILTRFLHTRRKEVYIYTYIVKRQSTGPYYTSGRWSVTVAVPIV